MGSLKVGSLLVRASFAAAVTLTSTTAFAASEILVRFREPQNNKFQAIKSSLLTAGQAITDVGLVNSTQGLVKLSFKTPQEAAQAKARLEASAKVQSVAANHYYSPAISYRFKPVAQKAKGSYLAVPFAALANSVLSQTSPDVQLPGEATTGDDPLLAKDWAMPNIRMPSVIDWKPTSALTAAVIDTGVDYNHEDLIASMWRKSDNAQEVGYDFAHDHAKPFDHVKFDVEGCLQDPMCSLGFDTSKFLVNPGHGTHCAGHVGAVANNALGIQGVGASVGTRVIALKFFYDAGDLAAGQGDDAAAIKAIDYAIKNGAKVISASWGGHMSRVEAEKSELKAAIERARQAGVLFVVAAGNSGTDQDSGDEANYPAAFDLDNMIVVAATDRNDKLAEFSCYGAKSVHIAAPGVKILSTTVGSQYSDIVATFTDPEGKLQSMDWDGTSMATPIVAGAAALVWSKYPNADYKEIRERILRSARKVPGLAGRVTTGGILDVTAALAN